MLLIVRLSCEYYFYSFVKQETHGKFNNKDIWIQAAYQYDEQFISLWKNLPFNQSNAPEWMENRNVW